MDQNSVSGCVVFSKRFHVSHEIYKLFSIVRNMFVFVPGRVLQVVDCLIVGHFLEFNKKQKNVCEFDSVAVGLYDVFIRTICFVGIIDIKSLKCFVNVPNCYHNDLL